MEIIFANILISIGFNSWAIFFIVDVESQETMKSANLQSERKILGPAPMA